ncbi:MAG TPA: hypothetical protein VIU14_03950 [Mesorhizobium sp.]
MSAITIQSPANTSLGEWIAEIRQWLRHARIALQPTPSHAHIEDLSDRDLRDISARQTDIGRLIDRDRDAMLRATLGR